MLADETGDVGIVDRAHDHVGVAVDKVVKLTGPHEEGGDELARVDRLPRVGDHTASARVTIPSENISGWTPRSFLPSRKSRTASGWRRCPSGASSRPR